MPTSAALHHAQEAHAPDAPPRAAARRLPRRTALLISLLIAVAGVPALSSPAQAATTRVSLTSVSCPAGGSIVVASWVAPRVRNLLAGARRAGYFLCGFGYRSVYRQIELRYQNCGHGFYAIWRAPASQCRPATAIPGTSMHERGQAIDFTSSTSGGFWWLRRHAAAYGLYNYAGGGERWHYSTTGG